MCWRKQIMIDSEGNISSNAEKDITESAGANIAQSDRKY